MAVVDTCSSSNFTAITVKHAHLDWVVDFKKQTIAGFVELSLEVLNPTDHVVLDAKDLRIGEVTCDGKRLDYELRLSEVEAYGSALKIHLGDVAPTGSRRTVRVAYETSASASALQWLDAAQTADKTAPYLFSQCQAIHARSLLPCMDTPAVKQTYDATVTVGNDVVALMSAVAKGSERRGEQTVYRFEQVVPMPSYLVAIVVGALEQRQLSDRCAVWTEPSMVVAAADEFAETEQMLQTAEGLCGPYVWGRYDILVLPPSFPFGGMENPCLTFVSPSLIAGDRSLASVIAHEISHSWTGNLVTNATWQDFWLNEGHTMFVQRKILSRMASEQHRHFDADIAWTNSLTAAVFEQFNEQHPFTRLVPDLAGCDPDDAFSTVPYEKGHALLFYLEHKVGGPEVFDVFLREYIDHFKFQSITTDEWKAFFIDYFTQRGKGTLIADVDWQAWFYSTGMPPLKPAFDATLSKACRSLADVWLGADVDAVKAAALFADMSAWQRVELLNMLLHGDPLPAPKLAKMDQLYHLSQAKNTEILFNWIRLCIKARFDPIIETALNFAGLHGRMKYCRPVYRDLGAWDTVRPRAIEKFQATRPSMHHTTARLVAKFDLNV